LLFQDGETIDTYVPKVAKSWPGSTNPGRNIIPSTPDPLAPITTVQTWYFQINTAIKWQDPTYGTVSKADAEYTFERGMVMDHDGGPQWMFLEPLLTRMTIRDTAVSGNLTEIAEVGLAIDNAVQSGTKATSGVWGPAGEYVWFNLMQPYAAFQQILCQSWGSVMSKAWCTTGPHADDMWPGVWGDYTTWVAYTDPIAPGPLMNPVGGDFSSFNAMMGTGPYYLDYFDTDPDVGWWRLEKFTNYWGGWAGSHATEIIEKGVADWSTRKAMFISEDPSQQVDLCYVPRQSTGELLGESGIRFMKDLPTLVGNGLFFNYDPDPLSLYLPQINGVEEPTFFSDRHARLAFEYAYDDAEYINTVFLGEAFACGNPIIKGIAYYNASKPNRTIDTAKVTAHLQAMWGGDPWTNGFSVTLLYNTGSLARQTLAEMLANVINGIKPGSVTVTGIPWATYLTYLYSNQLTSFVLGWQADFPDPHNWMMPFMHSEGDFSGFQNIDYGDDPTTMDWVSNTYGGTSPYNNYKGDLVTLSSAYVDELIEKGIQLPDTAGPYVKGDGSRNELYEELMDIFFAEGATMMTAQTLGRHYERDWVQGWYYNIIWPDNWYYTMWKEDPSTVTRDLQSNIMTVPSASLTIYATITNPGETWEYYDLYEKVWDNGVLVADLKLSGWIAPKEVIVLPTQTIAGNGPWTTEFTLEFSDWYYTYDLSGIQDWNPGNNVILGLSKYGDLGGGLPPKFFAFDGKVDGKDLSLFLLCFKGLGPF